MHKQALRAHLVVNCDCKHFLIIFKNYNSCWIRFIFKYLIDTNKKLSYLELDFFLFYTTNYMQQRLWYKIVINETKALYEIELVPKEFIELKILETNTQQFTD